LADFPISRIAELKPSALGGPKLTTESGDAVSHAVGKTDTLM
jgi:hypothetical protein